MSSLRSLNWRLLDRVMFGGLVFGNPRFTRVLQTWTSSDDSAFLSCTSHTFEMEKLMKEVSEVEILREKLE